MSRFHNEGTDGAEGTGCPAGARFGHRGFRPPFHGHMMGFGGGQRARRGDVRLAILRLLDETPMHGYQVIQELSSRSGGAWRPSPGSVYPTLQLLEDEGLVSSTEADGKRVYSITDEGRAQLTERATEPSPWDDIAEGGRATGMREAGGRLFAAMMQVAQTGSEDQVARTLEILTDARKKIYAILAED
jgi:DNA-binding PadR family transcriptional regulator